MHRNRPTGSVTASRVKTLETRSLYAADTGDPRPLRADWYSKIADDRREIHVGQREELPHGTLRCRARGRSIVVELRQGDEQVGRELIFRPKDASLLQNGAAVPESIFNIEVREFIGSPWHEMDYVSIWTVHGLRRDGKAELFVDV
jgi:hypothetical protein